MDQKISCNSSEPADCTTLDPVSLSRDSALLIPHFCIPSPTQPLQNIKNPWTNVEVHSGALLPEAAIQLSSRQTMRQEGDAGAIPEVCLAIRMPTPPPPYTHTHVLGRARVA